MVSCAHLGQIEEARDWLRRLLELRPELTIAGYKASAAKFLPPEILAVFVAGFRTAGLPEK